MKKKLLFLEIVMFTVLERVCAVNKISCGTTSGISAGLPSFIRTVITLIEYIVPLTLILFGSIDFLKVIFSEDKKGLDKATKKFIIRSVAGIAIFFVVFITLFVFKNMSNSSSTVECIKCFAVDGNYCKVYYEEDENHESEKEADNKAREELEKKREGYRKENEEDAKKEKEEAAKEKDPDSVLNGRRSGHGTELDFSCTSTTVMSKFSCETLRIVEQHLYDFDASNFKSTIKNKYGNFANYMQSLGGVFADFYGRKLQVTTASDLQWVSEYVFGMMYMFGFDYYNGPTRKYCKWGGNCVQMSDFRSGSRPKSATPDAFWKGNRVYYEQGISDPKEDFDKLISNLDGLDKNTNCNWTVDMVYYKAGIFGTNRTSPNNSATPKDQGRKNRIITNVEDVQVGDIIHFFRCSSGFSKSNPNTWNDWYHVAFVGEVDHINGTFTIYDGGSRYTNNRNYKVIEKLSNSNTQLESTSCWAIVRVVDLIQE